MPYRDIFRNINCTIIEFWFYLRNIVHLFPNEKETDEGLECLIIGVCLRISGKEIHNYQISYENISKVFELFPANAGRNQWYYFMNDKNRREKAVEYLEKAKEAETEGISTLEKIAENI